MSTATNNSTATQFARHGKTMFWRFVWKEFRMIRSLWIAVALMGVAVQWAARLLMLYSPASADPDLPSMLFAIALAAAVLYTVGAAATTFSVEHEEETYGFLVRLPATWPSIFAGKLLVTLATALLLAALLLTTGWVLHGPRPIDGTNIFNPLGVLGFAIVEALAWGTLFSLLIKRPLLAAIMTLVVGTLVTTMAVNFASRDSMASLNPHAYAQALSFRAAIVAAVFAACLVSARRWLTTGVRPAALSTRLQTDERIALYLAKVFARDEVHVVAGNVSRRRMLARLLWQTWRESWKLLPAPLGVALLLLAGIAAAIGLTQFYGEVASFVTASTLLFAPALYGAMAFYTDQRRGQYRFLAEHAARPRYTWFARHIVWLGALIVVWTLLFSLFAGLVTSNMQRTGTQRLDWYLSSGYPPIQPLELTYEFSTGLQFVIRATTATSIAALVAYAIGQLFSITIRSEILAAFLALLLTFVVAACVFAICLWQLSAAWFMFPIFTGLMLATWLRAPDWIADRNSLRAWLKPAVAIIAPFVLITVLLPRARLAQLQREIPTNRDRFEAQEKRNVQFDKRLAALQAGDTTKAARTADMYVQAATRLMTAPEDDLLKPWRKPEYTNFASDAPRLGMIDDDIVESKIPPDQWADFKKAQEKQLERRKVRIAAAVNEAIEISKRQACRFHFDASFIEPGSPNTSRSQLAVLSNNQSHLHLDQLFGVVAGEPMTEPDQPARRFLAALRMGKHFRSGQPSLVVIHELNGDRTVLQRIADWALESGRTKEELRDVLDKLSVEFVAPESPVESLLADHLLIRDVIVGKQTPFILSTTPIAPRAYLAYLANGLWWERDRALQALERITRQNIRDIDELTQYLGNSKPRQLGARPLHRWLLPAYVGLPALWQIQDPAAMTSYLASLEYRARVPIADLYRAYCDNEVCRRATLIQIALALYRLDHKTYPPQLPDLVPQYLDQLPLDPYSSQPFQYQPNGVSLSLRYWKRADKQQILASNTPFFWSVGPGNVRPQILLSSPDNGEPLPDRENQQQFLRLYEFVNEDQTWWNSATNTLAFPLPKLK